MRQQEDEEPFPDVNIGSVCGIEVTLVAME
jgi:hypothetical protein